MIEIIKTRKKIIGIILIVIGLSIFGISYNRGSVSQEIYSILGCAANAFRIHRGIMLTISLVGVT